MCMTEQNKSYHTCSWGKWLLSLICFGAGAGVMALIGTLQPTHPLNPLTRLTSLPYGRQLGLVTTTKATKAQLLYDNRNSPATSFDGQFLVYSDICKGDQLCQWIMVSMTALWQASCLPCRAALANTPSAKDQAVSKSIG